MGRSENSSWEKAPFKSGRTGAVYTRRVGQTASREVYEAIDCSYFYPKAVLPDIVVGRGSVAINDHEVEQ